MYLPLLKKWTLKAINLLSQQKQGGARQGQINQESFKNGISNQRIFHRMTVPRKDSGE